MATVPVGNLVDQFTALTSYWNSNYGGATVSGGYARVPCTHTGGTPNYAGFLSTIPAVGDTWTMSSTSLHVEVVTRPVGGGAAVCYCQLSVLSTTSGTYLSMLYDAVGGNLSFGSYTGFSDAGLVVIPHIPSLHRWWRIRHATGRVYWETSPDGTTWTVRRTLIGAPSWITTSNASVQLDASRNGGTNDYAEFDNLNVSTYNTTVTPSTIIATAAVAALSPQLGSTATPATVPSTAAISTPTISAGSTATPTTVTGIAGIPAPNVQAGTTFSPDLVAVAASVHVPTIVVSATMLAAPPGIVFVRYPAAQFVSSQLVMPLCGGSATTLSFAGSVLPVTLSGSAAIV